MLWARATSMSLRTVATVARQRGRAPQLPFIMSSTRSAVVLGSTLTGLSSGGGGSFTLAHSLVMSGAAGFDMIDLLPVFSAAVGRAKLRKRRAHHLEEVDAASRQRSPD